MIGRNSPRVRRHASGRATLAGLTVPDLSALLTCAALHCHASIEAERARGPEGAEHAAYSAAMLRLVNACTDALRASGWQPAPDATRAGRLQRVRAARKERLLFDEVLQAMLDEAAARRARRGT